VALRSDSEFTGGLGIECPGHWQILSPLIRANTGSGPQTDYAIDPTTIVSVVPQGFLQLPDIVPILDR
jgi:hypothetical protein